MEIYCTSVIPIKLPSPKITREFIGKCKSQINMSDYCNYNGALNLKSIQDINTNALEFYFIPSPEVDIQCLFGESTLAIVLTWVNSYNDYYNMVNQSLKLRKTIVKRILEYDSEAESLSKLLKLLTLYKNAGLCINYAFTFYSVLDENYSPINEPHLKVLAEPSVINMDDMLSNINTDINYHPTTKINKEVLESIKDVDIYSEQKTFITWASIVSLSTNRESWLKNHISITLIEVLVQRIWNLCYTQNNSLNRYITDLKRNSKRINKIIIDTYRILIESKNCISATYSSRLSGIYSAIVDSSQLAKNVNDLEQKLNYLIVFTNSINQSKNRYLQQSSEVLLFFIAIAQVVPIFFDLPIVTHQVISIGTIIFS